MGSTNKKKTRKMRGHVSHGHGRIGKHRKHPGGRGNAGGQHHHRINFDKYHPGYFGKIGMRNFHVKASMDWCPIINLDKIWSLVSEKTRETYKNHPDGKAPVIDVVKSVSALNYFEMGFSKVLGKGLLPKQPVIVKAKFFSRRAEEKIKAIGGVCVLTALEERGILKEMQLFFRQKMAMLLQDPELAAESLRENQIVWPTSTRAINWLIGEHMLQKGCCFSLSVFKSEAPFLDELPGLSTTSDKQQLVISPLVVENVLAEVGFKRGEQQFLALHADYRANRGSLLECVMIHSRKVLEGWKSRTGDYNVETLKKLSEIDAYMSKVRVSKEFIASSSSPVQDVIKSRMHSDLEKFREQERVAIREEERAKILEEVYWQRKQTELDLDQRAAYLKEREQKLRCEQETFENQREDHELAVTEAVRELEISEKTLAAKLAEVETISKRLSVRKNRIAQKETELDELLVQTKEEFMRVTEEKHDREQLLKEVESLNKLMNTLHEAVGALENENKRLKEALAESTQPEKSVHSNRPAEPDLQQIIENAFSKRDEALRMDMKAVQEGLCHLSEATTHQKSDIEAATKLVGELERKLSDAQAQLEHMRSEYYDATARRRLLEKKLDLTKVLRDQAQEPAASGLRQLFLPSSSSSSNDTSKSSTEDFIKESQRRMRELEEEVKDLDADLATWRRRLARPDFNPSALDVLSRARVKFLEPEIRLSQASFVPSLRATLSDADPNIVTRDENVDVPPVKDVAEGTNTGVENVSRVEQVEPERLQTEDVGKPRFSLFAMNLDKE
ncbi:unnamed protein product [Notodromas monacha]|uniref:Large ribosomal subunit protein uL15 n=1 Tax=Notodromas monacha TaxID=399045 RepID=A0A7R9BRG2_9CRUS|nr:unnamed protein product [Notodromas monacha]CAG0920311.1 unnamed protein product [Notodromas monacha]